MNRATTALAAAVLLAAALIAVPAAAQDGSDEAAASTNVSLGGQISIIVSAQQTEVESTVENEAFDVAFGERGGEAVNDRARELAATMRELEEEKRELDEARESGNLSESAYTTRMAKLETRAQALNESANHTATTAEKGLSQAEQQGVNVAAIRELQRNASELTGPEVAEIARSIAGPAMAAQRAAGRASGDVGPPDDVAPQPRDDVGPPEDAGDGAPDRGGGIGDSGGPGGSQDGTSGSSGSAGGDGGSGGAGGGGAGGGGPR